MIGERVDPSDLSSPRVLRWHRLAIGGTVAAGLLVVAHWLDPIVLYAVPENKSGSRDWGRGLRALGYLPTWLVLALVFLLLDWEGERWRRSLLVLCGAGLAGIVAEVVKKLVRRERPPDDVALHALEAWPGYVFRAYTEAPFSSAGLGMPSSHTAVAFGGMFMLCYLHPRASLVWIALAMGTGFTRLLSEAHYVSDAVMAGMVGWVAVRVLVVTDGRISKRRGATPPRSGEEEREQESEAAGVR